MAYRLLFALVLRRLPAETAHALAARALRLVRRLGLLRRRRTDPRLAVRALGLTFPSPLGVAAGTDKDLTWFEELGALGFGFVEVGTVTALAQPGNPAPRVHRLVADRALINSMGFPNGGAAAAARRLARRSGRTIVAVNVGRSKLADDAAADYRATVRALAPDADFLVLNVSSPNTPGLRDLQQADVLRPLVAAVREELDALGRRLPVLVKIAPDLADAEIDALADAALELGLDGIVAVNTTVGRDGLTAAPAVRELPGGVSGAPLKARAVAVLRRLHARTRGGLVLVSVGGVETADDVWERLAAGATLVQAYTGFVYGGPGWPARVNRELAARLDASAVADVPALIAGADRG